MAASLANSDAVFGHYLQHGASWTPALAQSSQLFQSIIADNVRAVEEELQRNASCLHAFHILLYWPADDTEQLEAEADCDNPAAGTATVTVKQRTLLMLAAYHGSLRVLSYLLSRGTEPSLKSPDGLSAYDFAVTGGSQNASTVLAMLKDAEGSFTMSANSTAFDPVVSAPPCAPRCSVGAGSGPFPSSMDLPMGAQEFESDPFNPDSLPYSTAELTRPEYATDTFRMFCFKVLRCSKRYAHDWRACPFAHPTENARRRDPREFKYCSTSCPDYKQGFCIRGDTCPYAHGVFESWLHPSRYRTQLCKDGVHCRRPVCFFAHTLSELRTPTYTWVPTTEDLLRAPAGPSPLDAPHLSPSASGTHSPDLALKPIKTHYSAAAAADSEFSPDSPLDTSSLGTHSLLDSASSGLTAEVVAQLRTASPDTPCSNPLLHKMLPMDARLAHSPSLSGSPCLPGSPTASLISYSGSGMVGSIAAPRMSNAFARKYGLNPRDSPVLNLQKIALAGQPIPSVLPYDGGVGGGPALKGMRAKRFAPSLQHQQQQQQHHQQHPQQQYGVPAYQQGPYRQSGYAMAPQQYIGADPSMLPMYSQQLAAGMAGMHPVWQ